MTHTEIRNASPTTQTFSRDLRKLSSPILSHKKNRMESLNSFGKSSTSVRMLYWGISFHLLSSITMIPLVYFEQRCQQIGPVMVCILYAQDRSPGTLLDQTPRRENKRSGRGGQDKKRSKQLMVQQQRHFPKA